MKLFYLKSELPKTELPTTYNPMTYYQQCNDYCESHYINTIPCILGCRVGHNNLSCNYSNISFNN